MTRGCGPTGDGRQPPFSGKLGSAMTKATPPRKRPNAASRSREYLTPSEVDRLREAAAKRGRHGSRDATMILLAYRHGLRVSELIALRWEQVDLKQGLLHVRRRKNGSPSTHPLRGPEIRALRKLAREYPETPYVFVTERKGPLTDSGVPEDRGPCRGGGRPRTHPCLRCQPHRLEVAAWLWRWCSAAIPGGHS